jgi:type IV pilus assembly protein PilV
VRTSASDNGGFTLVELMVAMLITLVGLLGLLKALQVSMEANASNQLRNEAVSVGEQAMSFQKTRPFDQLSSSHPPPVFSRIRAGRVQYQVDVAANPPASLTDKLITVKVSWNYKGVNYTHEVRSVRSQ